MLLSFKMINMSFGVEDTLFKPSKANPPLIDPSPIIATVCWFFLFKRLAATAIPNAAEIEFEACPHAKVSYSLSEGDGNGRTPLSLRLVEKISFLPVSILCP